MKVYIHFRKSDKNIEEGLEDGFWEFETLPRLGDHIFFGQTKTKEDDLPLFKVEMVLNSVSPKYSEIFVSKSDLDVIRAQAKLDAEGHIF